MLDFIDTREMLSKAKFYESYSRWIDEENRYETWDEAVDRVLKMHEDNYHSHSNELQQHIETVRKAYKSKLILAAQRSLQFGGPQLLKHQMRMYNCVSSYADRPAFFGEFFYVLLCGAGAGFSVQKHHVAKLPPIKPRYKQPKTFVPADKIEGWADCVDVLLSSFFVGGGKHPEYEGRRVYFDLQKIRPKGSEISGGFKAPGPEGLRKALDKIEHLLTGLALSGVTQLEPIHVYDICMFIADAVLSGGVRRSATICLFSPDDDQMISAKTGDWFIKNPQRGRSNNSAMIVRDQVTREQFHGIMEKIKQFGEPGFVFSESTEHTYNPCVEIGKLPVYVDENGERHSGWQGCNLAEINGGACVDEQTFYEACEAAAIIGTLQAGYTDFKFLDDVSKKIFDREALLGVSITGWMNNPHILFDEKILEKGADIVMSVNKRIAKIIGINPAARGTCVKPSGNASVILMTASGIHGEHAPLYIRNAQMNKDSEVVHAIALTNPHMVEESVWSSSNTDVVVSFPIVAPGTSIWKDDLIGVDHLKLVAKAQKHWVDRGTDVSLCVDPTLRHNVSNTILVDDWDTVEEYVFNNRKSFAGISFLAVSGDKDFNQAPCTAVKTAHQLVQEYGDAAVFAAGMVVDALKAFSNLWVACTTAQGNGEDLSMDSAENALKRDWVRRFIQFSENYCDDDIKKAEYCLKDAYLLHKWRKIQKNFKPINWQDHLKHKTFTDVGEMAGQACAGGACDISIDF